MIRCAEITHEKKNSNHQQSDWAGNVASRAATGVDRCSGSAIDPAHDFSLSFFALDVRIAVSSPRAASRLWGWQVLCMVGRRNQVTRAKGQSWYNSDTREFSSCAPPPCCSLPHTLKRSGNNEVIDKMSMINWSFALCGNWAFPG